MQPPIEYVGGHGQICPHGFGPVHEAVLWTVDALILGGRMRDTCIHLANLGAQAGRPSLAALR
jgi:hypothetical protein